MAKKIYARLMNSDGKYHYGEWAPIAPGSGSLFAIVIHGEGKIPALPGDSATPKEHDDWLETVRAAGFDVGIAPVTELSQE